MEEGLKDNTKPDPGIQKNRLKAFHTEELHSGRGTNRLTSKIPQEARYALIVRVKKCGRVN